MTTVVVFPVGWRHVAQTSLFRIADRARRVEAPTLDMLELAWIGLTTVTSAGNSTVGWRVVLGVNSCMEIIPFPKPEDDDPFLVYQCVCGCVSFFVFSTGRVQCFECDTDRRSDIRLMGVLPRLPKPAEIVELKYPDK